MPFSFLETKAGATIASAGTITPTQDGDTFDVSGTTTITAIAAASRGTGARLYLQFSGVLTLTHNAVSLILSGGVNLVTVPGTVICLEHLGSGNWREIGRNVPGAGRQFVATADATVANTVAETSIVGTGVGSLTIPANTLAAGRVVKVRVRGYLSDTGTPTLLIKLKLGSFVLATAAVTLPSGVTNTGFVAEAEFVCRTGGVSGTVQGQGEVRYDVDHHVFAVNTGGAATVDTTGTLAVAVTCTWGTASASNTITSTQAVVEVLN